MIDNNKNLRVQNNKLFIKELIFVLFLGIYNLCAEKKLRIEIKECKYRSTYWKMTLFLNNIISCWFIDCFEYMCMNEIMHIVPNELKSWENIAINKTG